MNHLKRTYLIAAALFLSTNLSWAAEYTLDPAHSQVVFKIKHLGISTVTGSFEKLSGAFAFDPQNIKGSRASTTIEATSISTGVEKRDAHLRSPDFLDVEKFPQLTFASKEITAIDGNTFQVHGDLTMHGVTRPVVLEAELGGVLAEDPWGNARAAFTASTTLNRKDFGLAVETGDLILGEEVQILLEIEGILNEKVTAE
ncbi:MAG: YceI family protein [Candidatus Latescibacteria bacterium]|nr:YceI family protein [Candidatus Latescibacterota bacterium]